MAANPSSESLKEQIARAVDDLEAARSAGPFGGPGGPDLADSVAGALRTTLVALGSSMGECRRDVPFSPLHPVIRDDGSFAWCCNHDPEHCAS